MSDMIARGMAANAMSSGGGGGGGTTVDAYNKQETDSLLRGKANASDVYTSQQTDDLLDDKVDKVSGKGLSTNDYTNEDMSLVKTISNKANKSNVDTLVENLQNQINETNGNVDSINTELMTNAGYSLGMSINSDYQLTMTLKNSKGDGISSQSIDLPIESMVVGASYANGTLSLKLQNNDTLDVDVSAIVAGLVNQNFTIAGIDMKDNIEANELRAALGVYTTTEVDNKLGQKANASTTYSKTEVDNKVSTINTNVQANTTAINATNERVTQNESDILSAENDIAINRATLGTQCKNIFDIIAYQNLLGTATRGTSEIVENGVKISGNGTDGDAYTNPYLNHQNAYKIPVEPNKIYVMSWVADSNEAGYVYVFRNGLSGGSIGKNNATVREFQFSTEADTTFVTIRFGVSNKDKSITYTNIMIRPADITDSTYEPYKPSLQEQINALVERITALENK